MHGGLQAQHAELTRDAAGLETRWMEVGTALEAAEAMTEHPRLTVRCAKILLLVLLLAWLSLMFWNTAKPLPPGTHLVSRTARLSDADVDFLYESPQRRAAVAPDLSAIDHAEQLIVLDRSPVTRELAQHLLARKHLRPQSQDRARDRPRQRGVRRQPRANAHVPGTGRRHRGARAARSIARFQPAVFRPVAPGVRLVERPVRRDAGTRHAAGPGAQAQLQGRPAAARGCRRWLRRLDRDHCAPPAPPRA